jgi:hypothetical protein
MHEMLCLIALEPTMGLFTRHTRILAVRAKGQEHFTLPTYERLPGDDRITPVRKGLQHDLGYKLTHTSLIDCFEYNPGMTKTTFITGEVEDTQMGSRESKQEEMGYIMVQTLLATPNGEMYQKAFDYFGCDLEEDDNNQESTNGQ